MATITVPIERTRYLMARSATFRTWCGITTGTEEAKLAAALLRVHLLQVPIPGMTLPRATALPVPCATIGYGDYSGVRTGTGGGIWQRQQSVVTHFWDRSDDVVEAHALLELLTFNATVNAVVDDMALLSGAGTHIEFARFARVEPPRGMGIEDGRTWLAVTYEWGGSFWGSQSEG